MLVFLDFEASSLSKHSYPIEIAWVFEDGRSRSFLIKPALGWSDWSAKAEAIHGISRQMLESDGVEVEVIADEMLETLVEADLVASAPSWDGKWLSALLRAAGHPRHALRLRKSDEAFSDAARMVSASPMTETAARTLVEDVIRRTQPEITPHRALPDAVLEWERWKAIRDMALRGVVSSTSALGT